MAVEQIKVKTDKAKDAEGKPAETSFPYDFGGSLNESIGLFGEAVVHKLFVAKATIEVQDVARNAMVAGKTPAEAAALAIAHKLGEATRISKDPVKVGMDALATMSPEQRKAFIRQLQEKAKELGA
jgi:hypothetical protein